MQVIIPHQLATAEVRARMEAHAHELAGSMAEVETHWHDEEHMDLSIRAMGQTLTGEIALAPGEVIITIALPFALSFMEGTIASTLAEKGRQLLA